MSFQGILFLGVLLAAVLLILESTQCGKESGNTRLSGMCSVLKRKEVRMTCMVVLLASIILLSAVAKVRRAKSFFSDARRLFL